MLDAGGVSYPLTDSRGTPMAWMDPSGALSLAQYGAFGEEGPANIGRFGFTGHVCGADRTTPLTRRYDPRVRLPEIGLDYYKARFYDPSIGRFLTPDPAGTIDSPNLYAYVLNDPINFTDPSGLEAEDEGEEIVVTGRRRSGLGLFFGAFSSGGNIGSGSFFHFLDPFADNSSQGPGTGEMMMCSVGRDASATQALANADGNLRAQQEIFRQFTNELSGDLFAEASRLYGEFAAGAVGFGLVRAEAASGAISYLFSRYGPVFGSNFYRGDGQAGFMNQGRLPNNFRVGFGFRKKDGAEVFRVATGTNKNTKHFDICVVKDTK